MPRAQVIVVREGRVLMVQHRQDGLEYWCLPGGGIEPGETPAQAAVRELVEECNLRGTLARQTAQVFYDATDIHYTFLVEVDADQEPSLGHDPEFTPETQILTGLAWRRLDEISEVDRAYLWSAGLMTVPCFFEELSGWERSLSLPSTMVANV